LCLGKYATRARTKTQNSWARRIARDSVLLGSVSNEASRVLDLSLFV
jgi:hypothetical protein